MHAWTQTPSTGLRHPSFNHCSSHTVQKTRLTSIFCWCSNSSKFFTTQIKQGVLFTAANKVYTSTNKTTVVLIETELSFFFFFFLTGVDASRVYVRAWALGCFHSYISTGTFRRALTVSLDSCAEIKSGAPSVA